MNNGFVQNVKIIDQWESGGEHFRLVDIGAGPYELQRKSGKSWQKENEIFVHGILGHCIECLIKLKE